MPLLTTLAIALLTALTLLAAAARYPALRRRAAARAAGIAVAAALLSALSALRAGARHSGMGTVIERGWPKPFHFRWVGWETGETAARLDPLYFAGNTLVWASALAVLVAAGTLRGNRRATRKA